jgi:hypothetical protein
LISLLPVDVLTTTAAIYAAPVRWSVGHCNWWTHSLKRELLLVMYSKRMAR